MTRWGRLVVLLVFAAGFLTMHGFFATSASADTHASNPYTAADLGTHEADAAAGAAPGPDAALSAEARLGHTPDRPGPAEHHDLVAGCVVALVGIALAGLVLLSLRRSWTAADRAAPVSTELRAIGSSAARCSPPRVALCVIRV